MEKCTISGGGGLKMSGARLANTFASLPTRSPNLKIQNLNPELQFVNLYEGKAVDPGNTSARQSTRSPKPYTPNPKALTTKPSNPTPDESKPLNAKPPRKPVSCGQPYTPKHKS